MSTNQKEDYAYSNHVRAIGEDDREVTGESIWNEYVATIDDEYLSADCFI